MSGGEHGIDNRLTGNAGNRFLARGVDVGNKNMIRQRKSFAKFVL